MIRTSLVGLLFFVSIVGLRAQGHCLIKVAPKEDSHILMIKADCGSSPEELLFAEGLQNTLKTQYTTIGVLNYMVDRHWELLDMAKTIYLPANEVRGPIYYTEFLMRRHKAVLEGPKPGTLERPTPKEDDGN